jgi:hypothetical protein
MGEALGANEIVALIVANLRAGDEDGAVEQACHAVKMWLSLNKQHKGVGDTDEAIWEALMENIFPDAPTPISYNFHDPERALPASNEEWFYAMCHRHKMLREAKEKHAQMEREILAAKQEEIETDVALDRYRYAHVDYNNEDWQTDRYLKRLERAADRAAYDRYHLEKAIMDFEKHDLLDAQQRMVRWNVVPQSLMPRRQHTVEPARPWSPTYPGSSDDDDDDDDGSGAAAAADADAAMDEY